MDKLYHGSSALIEGEIQPAAFKVRNSAEGAVVFATSLKSLALAFVLRDDDSWTRKGLIDKQPYVLVSDRERYEKADGTAYIYEVDPTSFSCDRTQGMGSVEFTSTQPVKILRCDKYKSALRAMVNNGVTICYVTEQDFHRLTAAGSLEKLCDKIRSQRALENKAQEETRRCRE